MVPVTSVSGIGKYKFETCRSNGSYVVMVKIAGNLNSW